MDMFKIPGWNLRQTAFWRKFYFRTCVVALSSINKHFAIEEDIVSTVSLKWSRFSTLRHRLTPMSVRIVTEDVLVWFERYVMSNCVTDVLFFGVETSSFYALSRVDSEINTWGYVIVWLFVIIWSLWVRHKKIVNIAASYKEGIICLRVKVDEYTYTV